MPPSRRTAAFGIVSALLTTCVRMKAFTLVPGTSSRIGLSTVHSTSPTCRVPSAMTSVGRFSTTPCPFLAGQSVPGDADGLAGRDAAQFGLIHINAHAHRVQLANACDGIPGVKERPGARGQIVDRPRDRRADHILRDMVARELHVGFGFPHARLGGAEIAFADQRGAPGLQRFDLHIEAVHALLCLIHFKLCRGLFGEKTLEGFEVALGGVAVGLQAIEVPIQFG